MNEHLTEQGIREDRATVLGFWIYLMTDLILFASLFATFMVLRGNTYGGPSGKDLFDLSFALKETMLLLVSSFLAGVALIAASHERVRETLFWLMGAALLGVWFVTLEVGEFSALIAAGNGPERSAFLSSYFTLVGTHGFHVCIGLIWMLVVAWKLVMHGFARHSVRKLALLSIFWHFLDIVWIFIFSIVYLLGAL